MGKKSLGEKKIVKKVEKKLGVKKSWKKSGGKNETGAINKNGCLKKSIKIVDKKYWRKKISSQKLKKSGVKNGGKKWCTLDFQS